MSQLEITFKSGTQILVDVTEVKIQKNRLTPIAGMEWGTPAWAERSLMHVDIEEIAAVVFIDKGDKNEQSPESETTEDPANSAA